MQLTFAVQLKNRALKQHFRNITPTYTKIEFQEQFVRLNKTGFRPVSWQQHECSRNRHFLEFGEDNRALTKKISELKKLNYFIENLFLIINLALKSNTLSFNFIIREAQFSFEKDSAQTTKGGKSIY